MIVAIVAVNKETLCKYTYLKSVMNTEQINGYRWIYANMQKYATKTNQRNEYISICQ